MDNTLEQLADEIRTREYKELFPDTPVEQVKNDEEKVKEAVFQVFHMVWNENLHQEIFEKDTDDYHISMEKVAEMVSDEEYNRIQKCLQGATVIEEDGEILVPRVDFEDVLKPRKGLKD